MSAVENLARTVVDGGEDCLLFEVGPVAMDNNTVLECVVGIDCGSTQTRAKVVPIKTMEQAKTLGEWFNIGIVIPSVSKIAPLNAELNRRTLAMYDNLDSVVSINSGNRIRIVRGSMLADVAGANNELVLATKKIKNEVLIYNIVDAIGYSLLRNAVMNGELMPGTVHAKLSLAMPPDDVFSPDVKIFSSKFEKFTWKHKSIMYPITVHITDIKVYAEPDLQVRGYYTLIEDGKIPEEIILLESGGRNSSPAVFLNGSVTGDTSQSIDISGSKLLHELGISLMQKYGIQMPLHRILEHALRTGEFKSGNTMKDVTDIVKSCKKALGQDLFMRFKGEVLSLQKNVSMNSLNLVLLSGRLFLPGEYNYSVAEEFKRRLKAEAPDTEVIVLSENLIPEAAVLAFAGDVSD
jgi:hypothetical protein